MSGPSISIIICSTDPAKFERVSRMYCEILAQGPFEIIRVPDAKSMSEGYNRGISIAKGDVLLFSHDDVAVFAPDFRQRLVGHLNQCDLLGVAGTTRLCNANWNYSGPPHVFGQVIHPADEPGFFEVAIYGAPRRRIHHAQGLDGVLLCCWRSVAQQMQFDAETFAGFHLYDLDFSFRAHRAGCRVAICNDLDLLHASRGHYDSAWQEDARRFFLKHEKWLAPRLPHRLIRLCHVRVPTLPDALEVMRPDYWAD